MDAEHTETRSPLSLLLASPIVRQHLANAGRQLAMAVRAGLGALEREVRRGALEVQYPYLRSVLQNVTQAVERWIGRQDQTDRKTKRPRRGPTARGQRRRTR